MLDPCPPITTRDLEFGSSITNQYLEGSSFEISTAEFSSKKIRKPRINHYLFQSSIKIAVITSILERIGALRLLGVSEQLFTLLQILRATFSIFSLSPFNSLAQDLTFQESKFEFLYKINYFLLHSLKTLVKRIL